MMLLEVQQIWFFKRSFCAVRATLEGSMEYHTLSNKGKSKAISTIENTSELQGISPKKGKSKDKSLRIPLLEEPLYTVRCQGINKETNDQETRMT